MLTPDRCTECDLEPGPCTSCQLRTTLADVEAMRAQIAEATGALQYARLAATWLVNHADRAHKYDRGYIDEVLRQIVQAESALDARGKGRTT